jgi:hypothetical protein
MGVPEGRGDVDDRLGSEIRRHLIRWQDALQQREAKGEKAGVVRRDHQGVGALAGDPGVEGKHGQRLGLEPSKVSPRAVRLEGARRSAPVGRLVGGADIADDHAVGVAAAHVGLGVVGADAVAGAADGGLDHPAAARHLVGDLMPAISSPTARRRAGPWFRRGWQREGRDAGPVRRRWRICCFSCFSSF